MTIESYASDFAAFAAQLDVKGATVISHSRGCFVTLTLALKHPSPVSKLVLLGPLPNPLPPTARNGAIARAALVLSSGMPAVVDAIIMTETSERSWTDNQVAIAAIRLSLLGQDTEGYAKGCQVLAGLSPAIAVEQLKIPISIITGDEGKMSPPEVCGKYASVIRDARIHVINQIGHWHIFEDVRGVAKAVGPFRQ